MAGQRESRDGNIRRVEWHIRHEKEIREAVAEAKLGTGGHTGGAPTGHTYISDPTANQAIRQADEVRVVNLESGSKVEFPERWLAVINAVRSWCGVDTMRAEIFKRRYSGEGYISTCYDLMVTQHTYHDLLQEIRQYAIQCACQAQIIKVF